MEQIYSMQRQFRDKLDEYKNSGCGDPPSGALDYATQPIANPWPQGSTPNWNPAQVPNMSPGAATVTGAAAIIIIILAILFSPVGA